MLQEKNIFFRSKEKYAEKDSSVAKMTYSEKIGMIVAKCLL